MLISCFKRRGRQQLLWTRAAHGCECDSARVRSLGGVRRPSRAGGSPGIPRAMPHAHGTGAVLGKWARARAQSRQIGTWARAANYVVISGEARVPPVYRNDAPTAARRVPRRGTHRHRPRGLITGHNSTIEENPTRSLIFTYLYVHMI